MDRRLGVDRPEGFPFNLNSAVDHLLKKEFDVYRKQKKSHPLMKKHGVDAVPFWHEEFEEWRENFKGVQVHHQPSNFIFTGAVDDVWVKPNGELIVVDYKATSKDGEITMDDEWKDGYKRQMEIYQWLLRNKGFKVSDTGYFVYANGRKDPDGFYEQMLFTVALLPYTGQSNWVEQALMNARQCLMGESLPKPDESCDYCAYRHASEKVERTNKFLNGSLF